MQLVKRLESCGLAASVTRFSQRFAGSFGCVDFRSTQVLQRLTLQYRNWFVSVFEAVVKYARVTSTPIGLATSIHIGEETGHQGLPDIADECTVYVDNPWLSEMPKLPKFRRIHIRSLLEHRRSNRALWE